MKLRDPEKDSRASPNKIDAPIVSRYLKKQQTSERLKSMLEVDPRLRLDPDNPPLPLNKEAMFFWRMLTTEVMNTDVLMKIDGIQLAQVAMLMVNLARAAQNGEMDKEARRDAHMINSIMKGFGVTPQERLTMHSAALTAMGKELDILNAREDSKLVDDGDWDDFIDA